MDYGRHFQTQVVNQDTALDGQIQNSDGAYVYAVTDEVRLQRFLILGSEKGSYYASEQALTVENAKCIQRLIKTDGKKVVDTVVEISQEGRAPKNDPAIFVLAMAAGLGDEETRKYALSNLPKVARIGTHLFQFIKAVQGFRGWGRSLKKAVANWYQMKDVDSLIYQTMKYQQRDGFSNRDALRLSHPKANDDLRNMVYKLITKKEDREEIINKLREIQDPSIGVQQLIAIEDLKTANEKEAAKLIKDLKLPREVVPTILLNNTTIWEALLVDMPVTAMIRNLGKMTSIGLLKPLSDESKLVTSRLMDVNLLRKGRVHPITLLNALRVYKTGHGDKGKLSWSPVGQIVDALDESFYLSIGTLTPSLKRIMLSLDVSLSMTWKNIAGVNGLTPRDASAAMALITAKSEPNYLVTAFSGDRSKYGVRECLGIEQIPISPKQRLDDVINYVSKLSANNTDCSLPMQYALDQGLKVDAFVVYTDSETNCMHRPQPVKLLKEYRRKTGIPAKLIVVGMVSNGFSVADKDDKNMCDLVGFDTQSPQIISSFIRDEF